MQQIKGTGRSGLVIPTLNIKSCTTSRWQSGGIWQQRSTQSERRTFICGGWFHPSLTETKWGILAVEDYDQSNVAGYSALRFRANTIGGNAGYSQIVYENYHAGGQVKGTLSLPTPDPDQWFHYMTSYSGTADTSEFWINGKYVGALKHDLPPYVTSQNRSNSNWMNPIMSRRYAGVWQDAQTYSGGIYSYFLMDLEEFKGHVPFQSMGMDPNDRETYYKPWMKMDSELIVPITDDDFPSRATAISNTNRGLYVTVEQSRNDVRGYGDTNTYTASQYSRGSDSDYFQQPVYGYTL